MQCAKILVFVALAFTNAQVFANDFLDNYYSKVEECIAIEKNKPDVTENQISIREVKYLSIIRSLRIEKCSKVEELSYIENTKNSMLKATLSAYNKMDLSKLTTKELVLLRELDSKLKAYSLETDLLSIFEDLEVDQKK